jgi:hypothetical protein
MRGGWFGLSMESTYCDGIRRCPAGNLTNGISPLVIHRCTVTRCTSSLSATCATLNNVIWELSQMYLDLNRTPSMPTPKSQFNLRFFPKLK